MGVGVLMPRPLWLSSILPGYTIDITEKKLENDRVCNRHFVSDHPAKDWDRMDIDWIPESWPFKTPTSKSSKCREGSVTEASSRSNPARNFIEVAENQ